MRNIAVLRAALRSGSKGFSLLEMAVVTIIVGLVIAAFFPAYTLYQQNMAFQETKEDLKIVEAQIQFFRKKYGRYPLPAPYDAERGAVEYGYESDWNGDGDALHAQPFELPSNDFLTNPDWDDPNDPNVATTTYPSSACTAGICIRVGNRQTLDLNPADGTLDTAPRVRIGTIPFRSLDLDEGDVIDGYGNRLTYAVVERLARATTYSENGGAIAITDASGVSLIADDDDAAGDSSAHFIVISHGPNGYGAFTRAGEPRDCPASSGDLANTVCDNASGPAVFVVDQKNSVEGATEYDDLVASFVQELPPEWKYSEGDPTSIFIDNNGPVGILTANPQERLDVNGAISSDEQVLSDALCDQNVSGDCFSPAFIAGPENLTDGPGMNKCSGDAFMVGIKNGQVICEDSVNVSCPNGEIMQGVAASGEPICESVPDCLSTTHSLCTTPYTVPGKNIGQTHVTGATEPFITSTCTSLGWQHVQTGACPTVECVVKATSYTNFAPLSSSKLVGDSCTCGTSVTRCHKLTAPQRGVGCSCSVL